MPITVYTQIAYYAWAVQFVAWFIGYFVNKPTVKKPHWVEQMFVCALLIISYVFLFYRKDIPWLPEIHLYTPDVLFGLAGVVITGIGTFIAIWARWELGGNWSGTVPVIKKNQRLVEHGPYSQVRHPIYAGFLLASFGTALTIGSLSPFFAVVLMLVALLIRIRREERMLTKQFPQAYPAYQKQTHMLIPFVY